MSIIPHHTSDSVCALCEQKLSQAHPDLQNWYRKYVKITFPTSHVSWSFRNQQQQEDCVAEGKSKEDWPLSKHNALSDNVPCSLALDLFQIDDQGRATWDISIFFKINEMNNNCGYPITWGGNFKSIHDYDHFELKNAV